MGVESSDRAEVAEFVGAKADTDTVADARASSAIDNLNNMVIGMESMTVGSDGSLLSTGSPISPPGRRVH